jgi:hypothetical protein
MDLQIRAGELGERSDVVLNLDVQYDDDARRVASFLAEIHEESPKVIDCPECGCFQATAKIFRCAGTREEELKEALACLDLLLGYNRNSQGVRKPLESRILELQARGAQSYSVRCKVYRQGHSSDNGKPIAWLTARHSARAGSSYVVPQHEMEAAYSAAETYIENNFYKNQPKQTRPRQHGTLDAITQ